MKSLTKAAMYVSIMIILSKFLGFLREVLLAYQFGTSKIVDAYTIAINFPNLLFAIFAGGVSQAYIPIITRIKVKDRNDIFNNTSTILTSIALAVSILCFCFSKELSYILSPGFDEVTLSLSSSYVKIVVWIFPFMIFFDLLCAHEYTYEKFIIPSFLNYIVCNMIIIFSILIATENNSEIILIGYVSATVIDMIVLLVITTRNKDIEYRFAFNITNKSFLSLIKMAIPLGISLMLNELNTVVDRMFASSFGEGITSALSYSNKIQVLFLTLTTTVFLSVCFPRVNDSFANGDKKVAQYYLKKAVSISILFSIPFMLLLFFFPYEITRVIFERGEFNTSSTDITASCLRFYALGIPAYSLVTVETRTLVANLKQKAVLTSTSLSVGLNLALNFVFARTIGFSGLPLATSLTGWVSFIILYMMVRKIDVHIFDKDSFFDLVKTIVSSIVLLVANAKLNNYLAIRVAPSFAFIISVCISCVLFVVTSILIKDRTFNWIVSRIINTHRR